ncbi:MAG: hypothetical protein QM811_12885 [Pirellulales bacterium]
MSMKRRLLALCVTLGLGHGYAQGAILYFDAGLSTPLTWDNGTTANWSATSGGAYTQAWAAGDATFEGTAGAVPVTGTIASVGTILFNSAGYSLTGGTLTLTGAAVVDSPGNNAIASASPVPPD